MYCTSILSTDIWTIVLEGRYRGVVGRGIGGRGVLVDVNSLYSSSDSFNRIEL